jgi:hypothetical protein
MNLLKNEVGYVTDEIRSTWMRNTLNIFNAADKVMNNRLF